MLKLGSLDARPAFLSATIFTRAGQNTFFSPTHKKNVNEKNIQGFLLGEKSLLSCGKLKINLKGLFSFNLI